MPIPKSTFRPIAPKPQTPVRDPDVIAVLTFTPSEIQEVTVPTTDVSTPVITKVSKKNNGQKTERASSVEEETGWDDTNTGLLISFLEDNFDIYKENKSNFAKTAATKIFSGKSWEQIKNKLSRLVTKYNEIKEKENKTGRETQVKWKWFDRLDALFGTRENHNPGFLVDGFSDDVQLFDSFKEKETETNEEFEKKQVVEKEIREAETVFKKEELEVERIKAETLRKKMEFEIEQSRMQYEIRMKELDLRMLQYKSSLE
ncbi:unnamed protein product [Rhizophagus irregularis]|nr:unnamed protein product [Rhizophagus irregularis]